MSADRIAITDTGYRMIGEGDELKDGETEVAFLPASLLQAIASVAARSKRDALLRASDWTQMLDSPLGAIDQQQWAIYRQALRDLPSDPDFPDCAWPVAPIGEQNGH